MTTRRILLTNDDGIDAPGLRALIRPLLTLGEVTVIAPVAECSGVSHSIIYRRPVVCERRALEEGVLGYALDAYPADCVKLAFDQLLSELPDLVVSGINPGANISSHMFYSGTVAAAMEASMRGVPSVAVSLEISDPPDFTRTAKVLVKVIRMLDSLGLEGAPMFNVNVPRNEVPLRGVRWARQSARPMDDTYKRLDGAPERPVFQMQYVPVGYEPPDDCDRSLLVAGYVTVTPIRCDLTCRDTLSRLRELGELSLDDAEE